MYIYEDIVKFIWAHIVINLKIQQEMKHMIKQMIIGKTMGELLEKREPSKEEEYLTGNGSKWMTKRRQNIKIGICIFLTMLVHKAL